MTPRPLALLIAACLGACSAEDAPPPATSASVDSSAALGSAPLLEQQSVPAGLASGVEEANFDTRVDPGDDFYRYVNGAWLARTQIPPDRSNYGSFTELADEAEENLHQLVEAAAAAGAATGSDEQKVGDFYLSFMDEERLESLGAQPLAAPLADVAEAASKEDLAQRLTGLNRRGVQLPFGFYINNDAMQSDRYIAYLTQSGLGLPDRDWYLSEGDASHEQARAAYRAYIGRALELAGYGRAGSAADSVLAIETRIAEAHWDRVRNRQRELTYNKMTVAELQALAPALDWAGLLGGLGIREDSLIVMQPSYQEALSGIWSDFPLEQWQDWASFKVVDAYAPYLSADFVQAQFDFKGRTLGGLEELRPRWKRALDSADQALGEVIGKLYVENFFQEEAKARMDRLVGNLREAFRHGIDELEWMTPATRAEAQEKLAKFTTKIGYPEVWKDYSALEVRADDLLGNVMRSAQVEHEREVSKLGQPVDRREWFMTPHTVNAYYNSTMNEIVFPAAILQPPFFNVEADDAVNYGAIGAVIGHEISHGFDDQGRKSDGDGNLRDWWTEADAQAFTERAQALVAQYEQFEVLPGKFLNGEFTLGENIGDLSGLAVAYRAWRMSLNGQEAPIIDGFSGDQRFFMGWAQIWRRLYRDADLEMRLTNDPHAHSEARSNGVLRNFDPWYEAFDVQDDDALWLPPEERVKIW